MRLGRRSLLACLGACCAGAVPAKASGLMCDFAGFGAWQAPPALAPASARAVAEVRQAQAAIGLNLPIQVFAAGGGNAFAAAPNGIPVIGYNPWFLSQLDQIGGHFAPMSVLAHEVGHHANGDTHWQAQMRHPWQRELGADFVSGFALARLNASADEATRALRAMFTGGSPTHPDSPRRIAAVLDGWNRGGGAGRLKFFG